MRTKKNSILPYFFQAFHGALLVLRDPSTERESNQTATKTILNTIHTELKFNLSQIKEAKVLPLLFV
jgi:hypothetical protein